MSTPLGAIGLKVKMVLPVVESGPWFQSHWRLLSTFRSCSGLPTPGGFPGLMKSFSINGTSVLNGINDLNTVYFVEYKAIRSFFYSSLDNIKSIDNEFNFKEDYQSFYLLRNFFLDIKQ